MFRIRMDGLQQSAQALRGLWKKIAETVQGPMFTAAKDIRDAMREEGKRPTYPIQWDSAKQRRAFFATDGFGRGIPTKRTGQYTGAWKAIRIQDGAEVSNPLAHARYIGGNAFGKRQSRIHRGRWKVFQTTYNAILSALPKEIRDRLYLMFNREGFKVR